MVKKHRFQFKSIQSSMTVSFGVLIAIILLVSSTMTYYFVEESAKDNAERYTYDILEQVSQIIGYYVLEMESVTRSISSDSETVRYFVDDENLTELQKNLIREKIKVQIAALLDSRKDITSATLFGYNGDVISYNDNLISDYSDIENSSWYRGAQGKNGQTFITGSYVQNIYRDGYPWVVSMSSEIYDRYEQTARGIMVLDMNYATINDICSNVTLGEHGYIYLLDSDGGVIWHPKQQLVHAGLYEELLEDIIIRSDGSFQEVVDGKKKVYTVVTSDMTGWKIVGVMNNDEMVENIDRIAILFILIGLVSVIAAFILARVIASALSKPIRKLKTSMIEVQNGNLEAVAVIDNSNEIGDLSHTFNEMAYEIRDLIESNNMNQQLKRKSEFKALQAQINPHFLYNTLDSIIWMSMAGKQEDVVEMTSALARLFRLSINKGEEMITLQGEVDHVTNYLKIQKYRYDNKLTYHIHLEPSIANLMVQKLILQPLVENAIYHGIKKRLEGGHIDVMIYKEDGYVFLHVKDNGVGMDSKTLHTIGIVGAESESGVGSKNVVDRLTLFYGASVDIRFESEYDVGTMVTIVIPIEAMEVMPDE